MEQGSTEWFAARAGKATASKIADIIAKTKAGWSTSRKNYAAELIAQRLTGVAPEGFTNAAMQWGIDTEAAAREAYERHALLGVELVAFVDHPTIEMSGASPDGLVGDDGLVEIKCPLTATHIDTLLLGKIPGRYATQMDWQMACTGRQWCDFVSYDPRLPEAMQLFVKRHERDDERIAQLEEHVYDFLAEVAETVAKLREQFEMKEAA
ncbi:MAG TPA: YqaJ viral recombinase family protein [Woeseiaceae bacterium]